jgi:5-methylcytosine-specific restriction endonuclease McrA
MPTVNKIQRPWLSPPKEEAHDSFYNSRQWRKLRALVLTEDPLCYYCRLIGKVVLATIGDHYKPKKLFPDLALDRENIKGCCDYHHQVKRNWEKGISTRDQFELFICSFIEKLKG